jgi:hypothetical protein
MEPVCPQCGRDFVRRCRRRGALEQLLSVAYVYSFRCQLCTHRFRAMEWGRRYERQQIDQREYERIVARFPAAFSGGQIEGAAVVTDLSMGGCGLETGVQLEVGALLELQLQTSEQDPAISVDAAVVRNIRARLAGVQFLRFRPEEKDRLSHYMRNLLAVAQQR